MIKDVIEIAAAALAPITAVVALSIAYRQYRLEKLKLKHELYEKRLVVFNSTMELLGHILRDGNVDMGKLFKFVAETNQSYFLLGREIHEYLLDFYKHGVDLHSLNEQLRHGELPVGSERSRLAHEEAELLKWFGAQFEVAREKFAKHLGLDE